MLKRRLANRLWKFASRRHGRALEHARINPRASQCDWLRNFLHRNAASDYGREYGYGEIRTVEEFQRRVPLVTYDDLQPWIERIIDGEPNILTTEPVLMFEKTSGSSGAAKYIPYTASLKRDFQRAIGAWVYDLFRHRPTLMEGSHYWSVSPLAREPEVTPGGLPVGIEDDAEYLGAVERRVFHAIMAVPGSVAKCRDMAICRRETMRHLLANRDLRLISVWHPSFLTLLLEELPSGKTPIECWPNLALISCWTSASAAGFASELAEHFPGVEIQGKGLLATEGVVTIPQLGRPAPVPALTSHFLEFIDERGSVQLVDELSFGGQYEVAITTGNGFARYRMGDVVEVVAEGCLEFVGRTATSDLCGEKLSEAFVGRVLRDVAGSMDVHGFMMLAPELHPARYVLLIESDDAESVAAEVEGQLRKSVHYDYCRQLGQLAPVEGVRVYHAQQTYWQFHEQLGQRVGDIKPAYLRKDFGWRLRMLEGCYVH